MCFTGFSICHHCPQHVLTSNYLFSILLCLFEPKHSCSVPHCGYPSTITHPLLPPCLFKCECLSSAATIFFWACTLVFHLHHVYLSANTHHWLLPCSPEHNHSFFTSTVSIQVWKLVLGHHPSTIACSSFSLCLFKHKHPSLAATTSFWAQMLVLCLYHAYLSMNACPWPPPCPFECNHSSFAFTVSIRAWTLVLSCHNISLSMHSCPSSLLYLSKHEHSSLAPTVFTQASSLILSY